MISDSSTDERFSALCRRRVSYVVSLFLQSLDGTPTSRCSCKSENLSTIAIHPSFVNYCHTFVNYCHTFVNYCHTLIKEHISIPLATIFCCSISSSTLPDKFKIASVIPVHKQGSQLILNNYRPISLLSIFNGLLERLVCRRLKDFITKHNLLYEKQFGFRSNHSTLHAVLSIIDKIQNAIEDGNYSCGIFLDLSKAFDTVNHQILLQKLEYYGIRGMANDWFKSYLDNRKQFVSMGGVKSDMLGITCGVPQGSVLGPILFLLYINDFHNCSKILDFHLFADDSNIFYTDKKLSKVESCINSEIKCVSTWLCANKLSLNIEKSSFVIFHPIQKKIGDSFRVILNNESLKREYKTKYLGVVIDCHLNWRDHVSHVSKKIKRNIGAISKVRHFVNLEILKSLYYALVYPYLNYCLITWVIPYNFLFKIFFPKSLVSINT